MAAKAKEYLQGVITITRNAWELLAKRELEVPLGWTWTEDSRIWRPFARAWEATITTVARATDVPRVIERKPPKREPPRLLSTPTHPRLDGFNPRMTRRTIVTSRYRSQWMAAVPNSKSRLAKAPKARCRSSREDENHVDTLKLGRHPKT